MNTNQKSPYLGGAGVIEYLTRTRLHRALTEAQATALWLECRAHLLQADLAESAEEAESSRTGSLDTLPREDVMDAIGNVLGGASWPMNSAPEALSGSFIARLVSTMAARGYAEVLPAAQGNQ